MPPTQKKLLGRYITVDPEICHGKLTFVGTRILVADVLEMVAQGMAWSKICKECHGRIDDEAISKAIRLAGRAFQKRAEHPLVETTPS